MPTCIRCGEEIPRGNYCDEHRLESGSTLGVVVENPNERVKRSGNDERSNNSNKSDGNGGNNPEKSGGSRGNYRGE
jgi:hypothetical protein